MKVTRFLLWWLAICFIGATVAIAHQFGWVVPLYQKDATMLTYAISALLVGTSLSIGYKNLRYDSKYNTVAEWFISDVVLTLGMIGTIIGFMIMLFGTFEAVQFTDVESIRTVLSSMSKGLYTALSTTLVGLISSVLIKMQLIVYETTK